MRVTAGGGGEYGAGSRWLGWLITAFYFLQSCLTIALPRTAKSLPLRDDLRHWHMLVGVILMLLLIARLVHWWRTERGMLPPEGMRPRLFSWTRALTIATYLLLLSAPIFGFLFAWSDGVEVRLANFITLPPLLGESYGMWLFSGYFHSGAGFMMLVLALAALLTAAYSVVRTGMGAMAIFPPGFGVQVVLTVLTSVWALSTFRSNENGPAAVGVYLLLVAVVALFGKWLARRRARTAVPAQARAKGWLVAALGAAVLVLVGALGPWMTFRVTPWPMGDVIEGPPNVTSHAEPVVRVNAWPETDFERNVAMETYKWCGFCHTYDKGGEPKAGPNLYGIFGQRAASVPNFHYSHALAARREAGMVWDDETLDKFLQDPDKFVPGTTMIISSGPVSDPKVRRAVINMLKRDTMKGAIDEVPVPEGQ